jgi:hypothetical protein
MKDKEKWVQGLFGGDKNVLYGCVQWFLGGGDQEDQLFPGQKLVRPLFNKSAGLVVVHLSPRLSERHR